jgi:hypothetical protein
MQRFVKKLIDNIQLKIKSVHIQIKASNETGNNFSLGILLKEIVIDTCNSN